MKFITCLVTICILLFYGWTSYFMEWPFVDWSRDHLGQFGDSWGVVTSIFSAFAFIGVVFTVLSQNESLKKLKSDSIKQDNFLKTQRFETNLFQMLNLLQSIIKDMDIRAKGYNAVKYTGRDVFYFFYKKTFIKSCKKKHLNLDWPIFSEDSKFNYKMQLGDEFNTLYQSRQQELGHYFRFLYNIFKYINQSNISGEDKVKYAGIVRAQISNYELLIIMYNCFTENGKYFIKYVEEYMLLDNISFNRMINKQHALLLPAKSFGAQASLLIEIQQRVNADCQG